MLCSGTDPESNITEYTLVYEDKTVDHGPASERVLFYSYTRLPPGTPEAAPPLPSEGAPHNEATGGAASGKQKGGDLQKRVIADAWAVPPEELDGGAGGAGGARATRSGGGGQGGEGGGDVVRGGTRSWGRVPAGPAPTKAAKASTGKATADAAGGAAVGAANSDNGSNGSHKAACGVQPRAKASVAAPRAAPAVVDLVEEEPRGRRATQPPQPFKPNAPCTPRASPSKEPAARHTSAAAEGEAPGTVPEEEGAADEEEEIPETPSPHKKKSETPSPHKPSAKVAGGGGGAGSLCEKTTRGGCGGGGGGGDPNP